MNRSKLEIRFTRDTEHHDPNVNPQWYRTSFGTHVTYELTIERARQGRKTLSAPRHRARARSLSHMTPSPLMMEIMEAITRQRRFQQNLPSFFFFPFLLFFLPDKKARGRVDIFPAGMPKKFPHYLLFDGRRRTQDDKTMFYPKRDWFRSVMTRRERRGGDEMEMPKRDGIKSTGVDG